MNETTHLPDSGFGKIFATTYTGSLIGSGPVVMAVWPYVIANARPPGVVELMPRYMATVIGCTVDEIKAAIEYLQQPDPESRTAVEDGRRLVHLEGHLYSVPTWATYRTKRDEDARRTYFRERQRQHRAKASNGVKSCQRQSNTVKDCQALSNLYTQAEAEAEADTESTCTSITNTDTKGLRTPLTPQGGKLPFSSDSFAEAWADWMQFRAELKKKLTPSTAKAQLKKLSDMGERDAIASIRQSISNGWQGLFEPKDVPREFKVPTGGFHEE